MESDQPDQQQLVSRLMKEMTACMDRAGELDTWMAEQFDGSVSEQALEHACADVAQQFLAGDPPRTGYWEHLLVALAFQSSRNRQRDGLGACRAQIHHLGEWLAEGRLNHFNPPDVVALASAMTVVVAIQDKVTRDVEIVVRQLCDAFPDVLPEMAQQSQDIWKRRGQMSGRPGLFLWDSRQQQWRLAQDFKPYRPAQQS